MSNWKYTNIQHAARIEMGLSPNEYCVYDIIYQSQTNPAHTVDGWAKNSYSKLAGFLGFSKGAIFGIIERGVENGFIEVNAANPKLKKTTEKWYMTAYLDEEEINKRSESERSESERQTDEDVQKVNDKRSESEHHIKESIKYKSSLKEKGVEDPKEVFANVDGLKSKIGPKQYATLNETALDAKTCDRLRDLFAKKKFWLMVDWMEYRKERRNHLTGRGIKLLLNTLEKYTPTEIQIAIDKAIESNYLGLHVKKLPSKRREARQAVEANLSAIFGPKPAAV